MNKINTLELLNQLATNFNLAVEKTNDAYLLQIDNEIIKGEFKVVKNSLGIEVLIIDVKFFQDFTIDSFFKNINGLHFIYCNEGFMHHKFENYNMSTIINRSHNVIIGSNSASTNQFLFKKDSLLRACVISVLDYSKDNAFSEFNSRLSFMFLELINQLDSKRPFTYFGDINLKPSKYIDLILNNNLSGLTNRLLFESSILKTLAIQYNDYKTESNKNVDLKLSKRERLSILELSDYISKNLSSSLTIKDLEKLSGLNQKKIQIGFKLFYNESVNKFITSLRVLKAKELIETTEMSMSEIVYNIGFSSRSYFSKIFNTKYGLLPTEYRKHRNVLEPTFEYCYMSEANSNLDQNDILNIIETARTNNVKAGITGCLIYQDATFFQLLEGSKEDVLKTISVIKKDSRHSKIKSIYKGTKSGRTFNNWSMALINHDSLLLQDKASVKLFNHELSSELQHIKKLNANHFWEKSRNHLLFSHSK